MSSEAAATDTVRAFLATLSRAQYEAATAPADVPLQILAGPGSGKTRVLVARVAWLIEHEQINPRNLVVVTFTNKAAGEMKKRLFGLIGPYRTANLVLGTFHATCSSLLRKYGGLIGVPNNFTIADADESKKIIKEQIKQLQSHLDANKLPSKLKPEICMAEISRAKSKNMSAEQFHTYLRNIESGRVKVNNGRFKPERTEVRSAIAVIYSAYEAYLQQQNALDFDDLLVNGLRLLSDEKAGVTLGMRHILVDEFQDTNTIQYDIMSCMGGPHGSRYCVTIVGDPDQSIYGWRSAEIGNLSLMEEEFNKGRRALLGDNNALGVQKAFLEENYRSTGKILEAAKGIIEGDPNRIERDLFTSHPYGLEVRLKLHSSAQVEAAFVATEIKRLVAYTGGLLNYDDFAILLRFNALSREVERQLQQENIPSRMMGGARFFERKEVKDILAYLTLADNPDFTPALERVINVPKRSIGEKTVEDLKKVADSKGIRTMRIVRKVAKSDVPIYGVRKSTQIKLKEFILVVDELRRMAKQDQPVSEIIETLLQRIKYKEYLQKEHDFDQRWENVKELINFSALVAQSSQDAAAYDRVLEQHVDNAHGSNLEVDDEELDDAFVHDSPIKRETSDVSDSFSRYDGGVKSLGSSPKGKAKSEDVEVAIIDLASSDEDTSPSKKRQRHKNVRADDETSRVKKTKTKKSSSATSSPSKRDDSDKAGKDKALEKTSTLHQFLEASTLSTDMEQDDEDGKMPKVTIATNHAAKGLEYPIVFIIAVESGTYPFFRATTEEEVNEEIRCLYVAATRAQAALYLTYTTGRMVNGETMPKTLSPFVSRLADPKQIKGGTWKGNDSTTLLQPGGFIGSASSAVSSKAQKTKHVPCINFATDRPTIDTRVRVDIASVLGRREMSEDVVMEMIEKFEKSNTAARVRDTDNAMSLQNPALPYGSFMTNRFGFSSSDLHGPSSGSGTPMASGQGTSLIRPKVTPVGFQSATSVLSRTPSGSGSGISAGGRAQAYLQAKGTGRYDANGWPIQRSQTASGSVATAVQPSRSTPNSGFEIQDIRRAPKAVAAPSFTDEYRMSKNEHVHSFVGPNGTARRPKADLASFQTAHNNGLSSIMNLLPGDSASSGSTSQSSSVRPATLPTEGASSNGLGGRKNSGMKRLGTGRAVLKKTN